MVFCSLIYVPSKALAHQFPDKEKEVLRGNRGVRGGGGAYGGREHGENREEVRPVFVVGLDGFGE